MSESQLVNSRNSTYKCRKCQGNVLWSSLYLNIRENKLVNIPHALYIINLTINLIHRSNLIN